MNTTAHPTRWRLAGWQSTAALFTLVLCAGCPCLPGDTDKTGGPPALDIDGNNTLATATPLNLATSELVFRGTIDGPNDIDVYQLGTLSPGDAIYVDVQRLTGDLDAAAAIFDSREYLVAFNDDRMPDSSNLNPLIDIVLPGDEGPYYLGIIAYPGEWTSGQYQATVRITRDVGVPTPQGQIVFLDWDGGSNIVIPNVGTYDLPPFSAVDVGLPASMTAALKDRVQQIVEERYRRFELIVLNSDDHQEPIAPHSTVYFGGSNSQAFAIAEQIDTFNSNPSDKAIVYTRSYRDAFARTPTFEELAQALGNTVAHEVGHLLGLVHTADCNDLMDTTCANERILSPQEFSTAPLDGSVWPFGYQSAVEILSWILGLVGLS